MFIINGKTIHNEEIFIAEIDTRIIWTQDVTKIKIFNSTESAATFLSACLQNSDTFDNLNLAVGTSIKISRLLLKELY